MGSTRLRAYSMSSFEHYKQHFATWFSWFRLFRFVPQRGHITDPDDVLLRSSCAPYALLFFFFISSSFFLLSFSFFLSIVFNIGSREIIFCPRASTTSKFLFGSSLFWIRRYFGSVLFRCI